MNSETPRNWLGWGVFFFFFLTAPRDLRDFSSPTRYQTLVLGSESTES